MMVANRMHNTETDGKHNTGLDRLRDMQSPQAQHGDNLTGYLTF